MVGLKFPLPGLVRVSVSDNGIGMEVKMMEKLFRVEENVSRLGTENELGTGLGLILCKEYIERSGGRIEVESMPSQGSTFHLTLPWND